MKILTNSGNVTENFNVKLKEYSYYFISVIIYLNFQNKMSTQ